MASTTANESKISVKLTVHKEKSRVLFAEADSNFVDSLFSIMTLPMGTIVRLLGKRPDEDFKALGSLKNLYQSLMDLPENHLAAEECKYMMLNPRSSSHDVCRKLKLNIDDTKPTKYFICKNWACSGRSGALFSTCNVARCSFCGKLMNREISFKDSTVITSGDCNGGGVFVSDVTTFIVTDDLRVMPNSLGFGVQLLCDLQITDVSHVEEKTFDIGLEKIQDLLKWALLCKDPLTHLVFPGMHRLVRDLVYPEQENLVPHLISNPIGKNSKRMTLKVTLQKSTCKLLFAEAEEDFVDFVFGFLEIPLGIVIGKLMNGSSSLGSLDNLFASISNLSAGRYIKSHDLKDMLLSPQLAYKNLSENQIFPLNVAKWTHLYYRSGHITRFQNFCDYHGRDRKFISINFKDPRVQGGYLKGPVRFLLTDDLVINPLPSFSTISMLNKLKVNLNDVEQHEVSVGIEEGLKILKASLNSSSTLTDALLQVKNPKQEN